jgi:uncharacterized protein (TIGR00288 family)
MAANDTRNLAVFCDFENVALGCEDAKFERFDIRLVLEKLLVKGSIVVKKAYCDWDRYKPFKKPMHEAAFELIEIPHVRQSGKNSADIRMVVDALDLCYTKAHVDTFVLVTGDSDFSPLVSKLRENNKAVIGVGVRASTSDLLIKNCDEFVFYDDLARAEQQRSKPRPAKADARKDKPKKTEAAAPAAAAPSPADDRRAAALEAVIATLEALAAERGDEPIWGSLVKQALKRRQPGFNESAAGYRGFNDLLADAQSRGLLKLEPDEKSGGYRVRLAAG